MRFIYVFLFHIYLNVFCECFRKHGDLLSFHDKKGGVNMEDDGMSRHIGFCHQIAKGRVC
jgi:hypothetical protein